jgi:hypothetical protein
MRDWFQVYHQPKPPCAEELSQDLVAVEMINTFFLPLVHCDFTKILI